MTGQLSPRDRRTLVLGAAVIALLVLLARGLPALRRWDAYARASAADMATEAARSESAVRSLAQGLDSLHARKARFIALGAGVLEGGSSAAAGASLASVLSGAAARAGVRMGSLQVRADTASAGTFIRVSVRADGTGDLPAITRMLGLLEGGPELLAIREIAITQPNPGGPAEAPETLRLELVVEGLALARPARVLRASASADEDEAGGGYSAGAGAVDASGTTDPQEAPSAEPSTARSAPGAGDDTFIPEPSP